MSPETLESLVCVLIFFAFLGGWRLFDHFKKHSCNENIFKKVGWIAEKESYSVCYSDRVKLRDKDLLSYLIEEQCKLNIPEDLYIDDSNEIEKEHLEKIIGSHRNNVVESYFLDFLKKDKEICKLTSLEYCMFSLVCFLNKKNNYKFEIFEPREYTDNNRYYCQLTDFGRAWYKLYLITTMFCKMNEKTKTLIGSINSNNIMNSLKNNKVEF